MRTKAINRFVLHALSPSRQKKYKEMTHLTYLAKTLKITGYLNHHEIRLVWQYRNLGFPPKVTATLLRPPAS